LVAVVLLLIPKAQLQLQLITADNRVLQHLLQVVELHQLIRWHAVAAVVMEILAAQLAAVTLLVVVAALAVSVAEQPVELALTQLSPGQLLCMEVVAQERIQVQELHTPAVEVMPVRH
jgi:hypothetical protein